MSSRHEGLLEQGYWEDVKTAVEPPAKSWPSKWKVKISRPAFFTRTAGPRKPLRRTAWLDGVRGFAALLVYWHHHQLWAHDATGNNRIFENNFGYDQNYYFACLPGVRTFFTGGHYAVTTFFVISGYALATKPLSLIHAGDYQKLGDNLASAAFRRWPRLYIPLIGTTLLYLTSWHAFGLIAAAADKKANFRDELWSWYTEFKNFSFVYRMGGEPWFTYNFHSWSIPVEFKGSMVIYMSLLAFSRCTRNARLWAQTGLIFYFLYIADGWYCALFVSGMLLCDLDLLADSNFLPRFLTKLEAFKELIFFHLFIVSVYLGGVPSQNVDLNVLRGSRGWYYLSFLKPQAVFDYKWFFLFWAATFLIASVPRIPWLKTFFETPFCQYLGRHCFALYLVHGPVLWTLGDRVYAAVGWVSDNHRNKIPNWVNIFPMPNVGPLGLELNFLIPHLVLLPVTLWVTEVVTKLFDEPSVKFSQWVYAKTQPKSATGKP
ncbi:MAG: hypothetical protein Q9165_002699 [Trypethelium subeluteriae]